MTLDRRDFLRVGSGILAGAACARQLAAESSGPAQSAPRGKDGFSSFRELFDLDWSYIHMTGLLLASHPRPVREAIEMYRRELDRNPVLALHGVGDKAADKARAAAARYLGVEADEVALTDSTTMGLGTLYGGFKLARGQEVLTTTEDHFSTHDALRLRAERDGAAVRKVSLFEKSADANAGEIVKRLVAGITNRTRLLAVTWVHTKTGVKLPIRAIADAVARINQKRSPADRVLLAVDGVHGFGVESVKVAELGCDFFVAGCHKWMFGPRGTGIIWGKKQAWSAVTPTIPAFENATYGAWMSPGGAPVANGGLPMTPGGFHSFEHRWALPVAFELHEKLGPARVEKHIHGLNRQLKEGLAQMAHVTLYTPMSESLSSGVTCFDVRGLKPEEVVARLLAKKIIASTSPYKPTYARLTPGLLNTSQEIQQALAAVHALA